MRERIGEAAQEMNLVDCFSLVWMVSYRRHLLLRISYRKQVCQVWGILECQAFSELPRIC